MQKVLMCVIDTTTLQKTKTSSF